MQGVHDDQSRGYRLRGIDNPLERVGEENCAEPTSAQRLCQRESRKQYGWDLDRPASSDLVRHVCAGHPVRGQCVVTDYGAILIYPHPGPGRSPGGGGSCLIAQPSV